MASERDHPRAAGRIVARQLPRELPRHAPHRTTIRSSPGRSSHPANNNKKNITTTKRRSLVSKDHDTHEQSRMGACGESVCARGGRHHKVRQARQKKSSHSTPPHNCTLHGVDALCTPLFCSKLLFVTLQCCNRRGRATHLGGSSIRVEGRHWIQLGKGSACC